MAGVGRRWMLVFVQLLVELSRFEWVQSWRLRDSVMGWRSFH